MAHFEVSFSICNSSRGVYVTAIKKEFIGNLNVLDIFTQYLGKKK